MGLYPREIVKSIRAAIYTYIHMYIYIYIYIYMQHWSILLYIYIYTYTYVQFKFKYSTCTRARQGQLLSSTSRWHLQNHLSNLAWLVKPWPRRNGKITAKWIVKLMRHNYILLLLCITITVVAVVAVVVVTIITMIIIWSFFLSEFLGLQWHPVASCGGESLWRPKKWFSITLWLCQNSYWGYQNSGFTQL